MTLDDSGVLCWWDTSRDSAASAEDRLTHSVELPKEECKFVEPVGFGVDVEVAAQRLRDFATDRARMLLLGQGDSYEGNVDDDDDDRPLGDGDDDAHTTRALADAATAAQAIA